VVVAGVVVVAAVPPAAVSFSVGAGCSGSSALPAAGISIQDTTPPSL
jgi:hypothetical protein